MGLDANIQVRCTMGRYEQLKQIIKQRFLSDNEVNEMQLYLDRKIAAGQGDYKNQL